MGPMVEVFTFEVNLGSTNMLGQGFLRSKVFHVILAQKFLVCSSWKLDLPDFHDSSSSSTAVINVSETKHVHQFSVKSLLYLVLDMPCLLSL